MNRTTINGGPDGYAYQEIIAAFFAVRILAEENAPSSLLELSPLTHLKFIRCETEQPTDDIHVITSNGGNIFIQAKKTIDLSKKDDSELASVIDQFVQQYINSTTGNTQFSWDHPLSRENDRLVLATRDTSSSLIRKDLKNVLERIRNQVASEQDIYDSPVNDDEKKALKTVADHIKNSFNKFADKDANKSEFREILSLIYIFAQSDMFIEDHAKMLLRIILKDQTKDNQAWICLLDHFKVLNKIGRVGDNRQQLVQILESNQIYLHSAKSFQDKIERLKEHTRFILKYQLENNSAINVGSIHLKIQRPYIQILLEAAINNSFLVVGEPGIGKSGVLFDLAQMLLAGNKDTVCFIANEFDELGFNPETLIDTLANWSGEGPGVLIIDSLDSNRGNKDDQKIKNVIKAVSGIKERKWRIIASIRKYDLRYDEDLQVLFKGDLNQEPFLQEKEFVKKNVAHFNIPLLTDDELKQVFSFSQKIEDIASSAFSKLKDLLRVPFNLWLACNLIENGIDENELSFQSTQIDLLEKYWNFRVLQPLDLGDVKENIIRDICRTMVSYKSPKISRYQLSMSNSNVYPLLKDNVLSEWKKNDESTPDRNTIEFSHHILFDYAVARTLLRQQPNQVTEWISNNHIFLLAFRPSLVMHFRYLWLHQRDDFWELNKQIFQSEKIPIIGKLVGPTTITEQTISLDDLEPLLDTLDENEVAILTLNHIVGALLATDKQLTGNNAGPWIQFIEKVALTINNHTAYIIRSLLITACDTFQNFTKDQKISAGISARRLLNYVWEHIPNDRYMIVHSLQAVCRTFSSDIPASEALIRKTIKLEHLRKAGYIELPILTLELQHFLDFAPDLIKDIYIAVFGYEETSDEKVPIGSSQLLSLVSNRRQDYASALYNLATFFHEFIEKHPKYALESLFSILETRINDKESRRDFVFNNATSFFYDDNSFIWDSEQTPEPLSQMLNAFHTYMTKLCECSESEILVNELLVHIIQHNHTAVIWQRLLNIGTSNLKNFGLKIRSLSWSISFLLSANTTYQAGEFIKAIYPILNESEQRYIENAILSIPKYHSHELGEHLRNRFIGCLPDVTKNPDLNMLKEDLQRKNELPPNDPLYQLHTAWGRFEPRDYLAQKGVPVDDEVIHFIQNLGEPVKLFADTHLNSIPAIEECIQVFPFIKNLFEALLQADEKGVHPAQQAYSWDVLTAACVRVAKIKDLDPTIELTSLIKKVIVEASTNTEPTPESNRLFDDLNAYGDSSPRVVAAEGLCLLAQNQSTVDQTIKDRIYQLSADEVATIRYNIAFRMLSLYNTDRQLMWQIIEKMVKTEKSTGVIVGLLDSTFTKLGSYHTDRVTSLIQSIFERFQENDKGSENIRKSCVKVSLLIYLNNGSERSREFIYGLIEDSKETHSEIKVIPFYLRDALTIVSTTQSEHHEDDIRYRAFSLLKSLLLNAKSEILSLQKSLQVGEISDERNQKFQHYGEVINDLAMQFYFASGVFELRQAENKSNIPTDIQKRLYYDSIEILEAFADLGYPNTVHHILEVYELFIPLDPQKVFSLIGTIIKAGIKFGYQYEQSAVGLFVRIINKYLAEYKDVVLCSDENEQLLIEILDIFVDAGWPSARALTFGLEEIFR